MEHLDFFIYFLNKRNNDFFSNGHFASYSYGMISGNKSDDAVTGELDIMRISFEFYLDSSVVYNYVGTYIYYLVLQRILSKFIT